MVHRVGYAPGVYDLFHVGHLNILRHARSQCDYLVAGVVSDEMAALAKGHKPVIPLPERLEIVRSVRYVDAAFVETVPDKVETWQQVRFDVIFKGTTGGARRKGSASSATSPKSASRSSTSRTPCTRPVPSCAGHWTRSSARRPERFQLPEPFDEESHQEQRVHEGEYGIADTERGLVPEQQEHQAEHPVVGGKQRHGPHPGHRGRGAAGRCGRAAALPSCSRSRPAQKVSTATNRKPSGSSSQPSPGSSKNRWNEISTAVCTRIILAQSTT